jgi:hypothetical protein
MKSRSFFYTIIIFLFFIITLPLSAAEDGKIVVMNPRGIMPEIRKIPMAIRPKTLDGKTVYVVDIKYPNTKPFVDELYAAFKTPYPKTTWFLRRKAAVHR